MNEGTENERDPVCGMKIDRERCRFVSVYRDKEYRFCSADCKKAFDLAPEKYIVKEEADDFTSASYKDINDMLEILTTAIEIHGRERDFFLRSARSAYGEVARGLFSELADDLDRDLSSLVRRKQRIASALDDLQKEPEQASKEPSQEQDPVCGMRVDRAACLYISVYRGRQYYFCTEACKKAFDIAPWKYTEDRSPEA